MKCERLHNLLKTWYINVQEETMAPGRMVSFMDKHISQCETCLVDPDVRQEAEKIRTLVMPPVKALKPKKNAEPQKVDKPQTADELVTTNGIAK